MYKLSNYPHWKNHTNFFGKGILHIQISFLVKQVWKAKQNILIRYIYTFCPGIFLCYLSKLYSYLPVNKDDLTCFLRKYFVYLLKIYYLC